ncbi:ComF family protein [Acidisoma cellulosilytica]|uniref:ComF family protein n=1 Tax=Acidisoma cellulosilyticum TaxID=2802395 RepID=A0A963Z197_9PROT|nr:ComF family protein [Acidisoma cellulosilyticum]MCB8880870.1 ComF family protein [Acidisoma cellulosilyticum]
MRDLRRELGKSLRRATSLVLDGLMPPRCPACGSLVQGQTGLCAGCFAGLTFITAPYCLRCGLPFALSNAAGAANICPSCIARPPTFRHGRAAFLYDEAAQRLILPFKHADRTELAPLLGRLMARAAGPMLTDADIILPVPLHRRRLAARRYNQAALLARDVAKRAGKPCAVDALIRHRVTAPLGTLSAAARQRTLAGAFALRPAMIDRLRDRKILLVDDVMTSGATLNACAAILQAAGAGSVDVLVAARVPDPRQREDRQTGHALAEADRRGKSHPRTHGDEHGSD